MRALALLASLFASAARAAERPNVVVVLADQWRAQAMGYAGDPNVLTPNLDRLAREGVDFVHAVSGLPVCSPFRASLLTGRRPLSHGVFVNDVPLRDEALTMGEIFAAEGYATGYIGKWHLDGRGRLSFTPPQRRQGFQFWRAVECNHAYNRSLYFGDAPEALEWRGYDAADQTREAEIWIREQAAAARPFLLVLSWGAPHDPYHTAPPEARRLYDPAAICLRENVPAALADRARRDLAGYYAHCSALDGLLGQLRSAIAEAGIERDTILVFCSDHGDLIGSQGAYNKQQPFDESIRIPLLIHYPAALGTLGRRVKTPIGVEDILPTLLGLCAIPIPPAVEGTDFSAFLRGGPDPSDGAALIACIQPFGQWNRLQHGAREYRGLRSARHTYVQDRGGPWLLFDNQRDPFQLENLIDRPEAASVARELEERLLRKLEAIGDEFLAGQDYLDRWCYEVDATGTVPYRD